MTEGRLICSSGTKLTMPSASFGFAYFDYDPDFARFADHAEAVLEEARRGTGPLNERLLTYRVE